MGYERRAQGAAGQANKREEMQERDYNYVLVVGSRERTEKRMNGGPGSAAGENDR